ncbi:hypothetical protein JRQ81_005083, partial [Phrynocephalus forsythii]
MLGVKLATLSLSERASENKKEVNRFARDPAPDPTGTRHFLVHEEFAEEQDCCLRAYWCAIFGGLVWILVASTRVDAPMIQGWDAFYQVIASLFYLSASVLQAYITYLMKFSTNFKYYQIDISAV